MRLLHISDLGLAEFVGNDIPRYAILSHTWGADHEEVTFKDMVDGTGNAKAGYRKIRFCEKQAAKDGLQFFWVDTCCIDKSSSTELTEAINSMFRWYQDAARCYVYLPDVSTGGSVGDDEFARRWKTAFKKSRWFTRGWTLQELIAPVSVEFFSVEEERLGDKKSLERTLHEITGIATQALRGSPLSYFSTDERMSWAAKRQTRREEDAAYSLLGIFNIHMPPIYGEGRQKALSRLLKEIKDENSINLPTAKGASFDYYAEEHSARCLRNTRIELATAPQAAFNALGKDNDPHCLPNTRVQVLQQIRTWTDGDDGRYIFWLSGWAGTGKSTIARTIAREYYDKGCLMASFFFSRGGGDVSHAGKFVGTIASQLAQRCVAFESFLIKAKSNDEGISSKTVIDQWNGLILQPLRELDTSSFQAPLLIVIDALDECEKESDVRQVLHLLSDFRRLRGLHCRVFITSRPDLPVRHGFSFVPDQDHQDFVLHDISRSVVDDDIFIYLQHALTDIQRKYYLKENWPGGEAIRHLVQKSAGLFIWAATASRFIDDGGTHLCSDRLSDILKGDSFDIEPEEELNNIYTKVLENSISSRLKQHEKDKVHQMLREALGAIVTLFSPLSAPSLAQLLHMPEWNVSVMLGGLHSILDISKDPTKPVRLHHPSLRDFLLSSQRCGNGHFWIDEKKAHKALANHCIQLMSDKLQRDICGFDDPGARVAQVPPENITRHLPTELQYACMYWVDHLQRSEYQLCDSGEVHGFLQDHLLHWMEALSWIKHSSIGIHVVVLLESMANSSDSPNLHAFLHDAKRFLLYNRSIIEDAPLQMYCSALAFAPQRSLVRKQFKEEIFNWIKRSPQRVKDWSALVQTLEGHTDWVNTVVFSPDSKLVASASSDRTIWVWDAATGTAVQTLRGHTDGVNTVVFSPDGKLIASASSDRTIRVWEAVIGTALQKLKGHTHWVNTAVFSPNSKLVASASSDKTVRVWDAATGAAVQTLKGHTHWVNTVIFSPDSKLVASASSDRTIWVWDAVTGAVVQTLKGHADGVNTVVFSPDGKLVASASSDKTVRVWDAATGATVQALKGHTNRVNTVIFSPDSKLIASASGDRTIWVWDAAIGAAIQTFKGHTDRVNTVAFSPDSKLVVSASSDKTVRVWDAVTGAAVQTLKGHTYGVNTVVFSPDSKLVASASGDWTVRLWDTTMGAAVQMLKSYTWSVNTVVFSPDGKLVASALSDGTVQIWDTVTGAIVQTLRGHTSPINAIGFSPNGKLVASASSDYTVQLWDAVTGAAIRTLKGHILSINPFVFSPDSKLIASAWYNGAIWMWNAATGAIVQMLEGHTWTINIIAFSPDSKLVASASDDGTIRVWNATTGAAIQMPKGHTYGVNTVVFSPDSKLVVSASSYKTIRVWDPATGAAVRMLKGHTDGVNTVVFSPDGKLVASASSDCTVRLWDAATGTAVQTLKGHTGKVNTVVFSPDSKLIASASGDRTIWVWDAVTGAAMHVFKNCFTSTLAFSKDGLYLRTDQSSHIIDSNLWAAKQNYNSSLFIEGNWISFGNTRLLWLPPEYRPSSSAFQDNLVVLGLPSGIAKFIEFNIP